MFFSNSLIYYEVLVLNFCGGFRVNNFDRGNKEK